MVMLAMQPSAISEVGRRRNNEDAVFVSSRLVAVADGVGGAAAGEVASGLAIGKMMGLEKRRLLNGLEDEFAAAVADANDVIGFVAECDPSTAGMATTLTAVAISNGGDYLVANVGDSRTYLLRDGQLRQLTRDHSFVQELIDRGALTEDEARGHPQRNVVMESLDGVERLLPGLRAVQASCGDRLLLCSDGVTDYLADEQIVDCMRITDRDLAVWQLVNSALEQGSRDNVTVVIADVIQRSDPCDGWLGALSA